MCTIFAQEAPRAAPRNLGAGLRELVEMHKGRPSGAPELALRGKVLTVDLNTGERKLVPNAKRAMLVDSRNRLLLAVTLDGTAAMEDLRAAIAGLGATIAAENPDYRNGSLSVFVPLRASEQLARLPGVAAVKLVHRPYTHAGAVTSQGAAVIHSNQLNASGLTGQGITVGILSDSFNGVSTAPTAYDDVTTGDLPNIGVADGRPGLKFLSDGGDDLDGFTDEGRAIAQILYDVAPGVNLCFASAVLGPAAMATNIRRMRRDSTCAADILVDDITWPGEPWFSDGEISQAVNDVVTGSTLAGKKVAYFTAAGNDAGGGYAAPLQFVSDTAARALTGQLVDLTTIPSSIDTSGGFHNFTPAAGGAQAISQTVNINGVDPQDTVELIMQWDDPYDLNPVGITTDLNLLIFNSAGKYVTSLADDSFSLDEPIQGVALTTSGTFHFVISRTGKGSHLATQVRYEFLLGSAAATVSGDYLGTSQPAIMEHSGAMNAITVGAYLFDNGLNSAVTPELQPYSSAGPVLMSFDTAGKRLSSPVTVQKPDIAAPDCVSNTFLGGPDNDDAFFTFCGTSAAAPHAAGVAALLLQNSGGPGSLTPEQIRSKLQASPGPRDLDPFFSQANLAAGPATVNITATGNFLDGSEDSPNLFRVTFNSATAGQTLTSLTIDLTPAGLNFNPSTRTGFPFTAGISSAGVTVSSGATARAKTLTVTFGGMTSGNFASFGIEPDIAVINQIADSADLLAGATVTANLSGGTTLTGTFVNKIGTGYAPNDGFGLIDAAVAVKAP
jgi:Subtilase family